MVVGFWPTEVIEELHTLFDGVDITVEELALVHRSVRTTLPAGAAVRDHHADRVAQLPGLFEIVQDSADLGVGVAQEPGEDLGHPAEELLLLVVERVPRTHCVLQRPRLPPRAPHAPKRGAPRDR